MTSVSGGGNYVSDASIMEWLAKQQDRIYGDLRDSIHSSEARAQFANELNDIKAGLHAANRDPNHNFNNVDQQLQNFMQKYGSDPEFSDLCQGMQGIADDVHVNHVAQLLAQQGTQAIGDFVVSSARDGMDEATRTKIVQIAQLAITSGSNGAPHPQVYDDNKLKEWDDSISGKLDVAGKNDQLTMIHIQQLKATIDQGSQFGSQFIASGDKTSSSIINNIA